MNIYTKQKRKHWLGMWLIVILSAMAWQQAAAQCVAPPVGCSTTDLKNFGFNSNNNAATIEYDNFISGFHQTMVRTSDGSFKVWGESMGSSGVVDGTYASGTHILSPQVLNSTNYPGLTGTPLKVAMGGSVYSQQVVLTTTGLFAWGFSNILLATSLTTSTTFQKITVNGKADGLPAGVTPADVKMLYGTAQTLVITTCSGNVWVLAVDASARGNGGTGAADVWSQVTTTSGAVLTNVVAARGSRMGLMALKSDGTVWIWGAKTNDGTGSIYTDRNRAVQMTLPAGITVKMIGATSISNDWTNNASTTITDPSFYVLATDGNLYAMGANNVGQLGDWTTINRTTWVQPRYTSATGPVMNNIKWMSPDEHDCYAPGMNVISTTGALTAWSFVNTGGGTFGFTGTASNNNDPATPAGIGASDVILAVETGGHTSMIVKQCEGNFGYVGHFVDGSAGNGSSANSAVTAYTYATSPVQICGAETANISISQTPTGPTGKYCVGSVIPITAVSAGGILSATGPGTLSGNTLTVTGAGTITLVYNLTSVCGTNLVATLDVATEVCCKATTAPTLSATTATNICPVATINLNSLVSSSPPSGTSLVWFTNNAHTGTAYATPTAATGGTYYAFYFDATNNCYGSASAAVTFNAVICKTTAEACSTPVAGCSTTNLSNFGFNSDNNAATIEYDNFVSGFHQTVVRTATGSFQIWGQHMASDGVNSALSPTTINSTNYPGLTGTPLKATMGGIGTGAQVIVLTTTGLFSWGDNGAILNAPNNSVQKLTIGGNTNGLPTGINPADVKMMFGSSQTLAIVTCSGDVWVISAKGNFRGNGAAGDGATWYRVTTNAAGNPFLTNVVSVRGNVEALMALKSDGTVWTWGDFTYLGDGTAVGTQTRATQMTLPAGKTPKMIAATYRRGLYMLATDGNLYSLGQNDFNQLGDWTTTERLTWVQPRYTSAAGPVMNDIRWINGNEHSGPSGAGVNAITNTGVLYAWGESNAGAIGLPNTGGNNPAIPIGLTASDVILAVETGGHTSMIVKQCEANFGYTGHFVDGSAGNGVAANSGSTGYIFSTSPVQICGAESIPTITITQTPTGPTGKYCVGSVLTVNTTPAGGTLSVLSGPGTLSGNTLTIVGAGTVTLSYLLVNPCTGVSTATLDVATEVCCTVGNAGADKVSACASGNIPLTAITTTGTWTAKTGNPVGGALGATTAGVANVQFATGASGTYSYIYTDGTCKDTMNVVVTCPPAFNCSSGNGYLFKGTSNTTPTSMYAVDLSTGLETLVAANITAQNINGLGYNVKDGYIWGTPQYTTDTLVRVANDGTVNFFRVVGAPPANVGDVDANGILYSRTGGTIIKMDVNPASATYLTVVGSPVMAALPGGFGFADWAFNPIDGYLYTINNNGEILKIDLTTPSNTILAYTGTTIPVNNYGAVYFDNAGNLYASNNTTGGLYKVSNLTTAPVVSLIATGTPASGNDGARCTNACVKPNAGPDQANVVSGSTVTLAAQVTNTGAWTAQAGNPATTTFANASLASSTVTGFTAAGTYKFIWSVLGGCADTMQVTVILAPIATNDVDTYSANTPKTVNVLTNDITGGAVVATTVSIVGGSNPDAAGEFLTKVVAGEGTWTVNPTTGAITFTPLSGYVGNPTPIQYTVKDAQGNTSNAATVTLTSTCQAGTTAPTLSAITKANVCPATTVDLTSIIASNLPASTTLTWHTGTPATTANKIAGTAVAAGTYYAAFYDATNNCYSSATTAVNATVSNCAIPICNTTPTIIKN